MRRHKMSKKRKIDFLSILNVIWTIFYKHFNKIRNFSAQKNTFNDQKYFIKIPTELQFFSLKNTFHDQKI